MITVNVSWDGPCWGGGPWPGPWPALSQVSDTGLPVASRPGDAHGFPPLSHLHADMEKFYLHCPVCTGKKLENLCSSKTRGKKNNKKGIDYSYCHAVVADGFFPIHGSLENVGELPRKGQSPQQACCRGGNRSRVMLAAFSLITEIWKWELEIPKESGFFKYFDPLDWLWRLLGQENLCKTFCSVIFFLGF